MDKYQETFDTWNKIAEIYQAKFMDLPLYNSTYDVFLDLILKDDSSILEIACGPGNISKYLFSKREILKLKGIDISENMVRLVRKNNPQAEFEVMDCRKVRELKEKFDAIICGFGVPYLSQMDCSKLIADCNNLLSGPGILYLSFVEGDYGNSGYISGSNGSRTYFYYHNKNFFVKELSVNSFEIKNLSVKKYLRGDGTIEEHIIIISKKNMTSIFFFN